jgi:hypothetical protein
VRASRTEERIKKEKKMDNKSMEKYKYLNKMNVGDKNDVYFV